MRNERYRKNAISVRERHNERKNEVYSNPDVLLEYSRNNVTFKACEAATYGAGVTALCLAAALAITTVRGVE